MTMDTAAPGSAATHAEMANAIRALAMDAVEAANSGHPGMPMGMADAATVLFTRFLKYDPQQPNWPDRDRFILSAGHGSMLLYSLLYLTGYGKMTIAELKRFRQLHSITPGHPEVDRDAGIETTTGPLGQGLANAVGFALAERILNARFGDALVDHHTYVIAGDGCMMEGISHEACSLAGHLKLGRLIVLYDDNQISIDGPTSLSFGDDTAKRFEAYGWGVQKIDGLDPEAVAAAIAKAQGQDRPQLIACRTLIGYGAPNKQGTAAVHGSPLGAAEVAAAKAHLGWTAPPFEIPAPILEAWRAAGRRGAATRGDWQQRLAAAENGAEFTRIVEDRLPDGLDALIAQFKAAQAAEKPKIATRTASGRVLELLVPAVAELMGGSADLTPSNNTRTKDAVDVKPGAYGGRYIRYGVREHGMAAAMNGMALHGGIIPYGGTFLTFSDYCRPSIRLAALMSQRVIFVMTHDSIGLGEDGPTHQPIEQIAALRTIPNLLVFRPADVVETAEAWQIAIERTKGPSLLALTRQNLPTLRTEAGPENLSARGGYVLSEPDGPAAATLFATGSELSIAVAARDLLAQDRIAVRVVSIPCFELFRDQDEAYRRQVIGAAPVRVGIEAAVRQGWDAVIGADGAFIGLTGYGASAPYEQLYEHFGITAAAAADAVRARL